MACNVDSVALINIALCAIIVVFGIWGYLKNKSRMALFLGIAFALFGASHIMAEMATAQSLCGLATIRLVAYLVVILAIYGDILKK